jgi:hypothetical protein
MFRFALALIQAASALFRYMDKASLIHEGERLQIAKELEAAARAASVSKKIRDAVNALSESEVDAQLSGDMRP